MVVNGADVAQLRATAVEFTKQAGALESSAKVLHSLIGNGTHWRGPDAERFRSQWTGESLRTINAAVEALRRGADDLRRNAGEQERASVADTGATDAGEPSALSAVDLYNRIEDDNDRTDDGVHIDKVIGPDGKVRLIVYLEGTGGADRLTALRNLDVIDGKVDEYLTGKIDAALASCPGGRDTEIMLVGFSQGGMDAQNIAASGRYEVTDMVTYGSPIIQPDQRGIATVHLRAEGDNIPHTGLAGAALDSTPRSYPLAMIDSAVDTADYLSRTATPSAHVYEANPGPGVGSGALGNHTGEAYRAVAEDFQRSTDPDVVRMRKSMEKFQGPVVKPVEF